MLRSLEPPPEPVIQRLCREGDWQRVLERAASHPAEVAAVQHPQTASPNITNCLQVAVRATCHHHRQRGLSVDVIQALLRANPRQIAVTNRLTGTLLHEAIQYRCSNAVVHHLIQRMADFSCRPQEQQQRQRQRLVSASSSVPQSISSSSCSDTAASAASIQTQHNGIILNNHINLLSVKDDIGRTALHCMVGRWQRTVTTSTSERQLHTSDIMSDVQLFQHLLTAYPEAASTVDSDGNTPLILLLQTHLVTSNPTLRDMQEADLRYMVQQILSVNPLIATLARSKTLRSRWFCHNNSIIAGGTFVHHHPQYLHHHHQLVQTTEHRQWQQFTPYWRVASMEDLVGGITNTPLSYALLNGRSAETVSMLLTAAAAVGGGGDKNNNNTSSSSSSSLIIVSQYHEVCLHIAVTTNATLAVLQHVLNNDDDNNPSAATVCDVYGLTPVDWLWACYVRDWQDVIQQNNNNDDDNGINNDHLLHQRTRWSQFISRRRHLPSRFLDLHALASAHVPVLTTTTTAARDDEEESFNNQNNSNEMVTRAESSPAGNSTNSTRQDAVPNTNDHQSEAIIRRQHELLCRMHVLLTAAAQSNAWIESKGITASDSEWHQEKERQHPWSLLHAVCYVPCPRAMVRLAVMHHYGGGVTQYQRRSNNNNDNKMCCATSGDPLRSRDVRAGRYPLHYAAGRVGYVAAYPAGFSSNSSSNSGGQVIVREPSPIHDILPLFPEACRATDGAGQQLPLHIAIDAFKRHRLATAATPAAVTGAGLPRSSRKTESNNDTEQDEEDDEEDQAVQLLLSHYPEALNRRDGKTKLFPWQQAAVGSGARLATIYKLLRSNPTLLTTIAT